MKAAANWQIMTLKWRAIIFTIIIVAFDVDAHDCTADDFNPTYTTCADDGTRWRVYIPRSDSEECTSGAPMPTKAVNCSAHCEPGQYLSLTEQRCLECAGGTFSLGGGVRYEDFIDGKLPSTFAINNEHSSLIECPKNGGWQVSNGYLTYIPSPCTSTLTLSVELTRSGYVAYTYRLPRQRSTSDAIIFTVDVQNAQCQSLSASKVKGTIATHAASRAARGQWEQNRINLEEGRAVVHWKVAGQRHYKSMSTDDESTVEPETIRIAVVDVVGVAFADQCTHCPPGTYSSEGAHYCTPCSENTFADSSASTVCTPCASDSYSSRRASACAKRPPCTQKDYYQSVAACDDTTHLADVTYLWVQPHNCRDDLMQSIKLPGTHKKACAECNEGMHKVNGVCEFCPTGEVGDGQTACRKCAPGTVPDYGYYYEQFDVLPPNMGVTCQNMDEEIGVTCDTKSSWIPAGDRIHTAHMLQSGVVLELNISVPFGFDDPLLAGEPSQQRPIGRVQFEFDIKCVKPDCQFYFAQLNDGDDFTLIEMWNGTQQRQVYSHSVTSRQAVSYIWAFIRSASFGDDATQVYMGDEASIYSLHITNVRNGGGARECRTCPVLDGVNKKCMPCAPGEYIDKNTHTCIKCPPDTMLNGTSDGLGVQSCVKCGPLLQSADGVDCSTNGKFTTMIDGATRRYDISSWGDRHEKVSGVRVFTSEGTGYLHQFNVTILTQHNRSTCTGSSNMLEELANIKNQVVKSWICKSTLIPSFDSNGDNSDLYVTPISLADQLIAITTDDQYQHIKAPEKSDGRTPTIHLYYTTRTVSSRCPYGIASVVSLRCNPLANDTRLSLPRACPDATCDGCTFQFILEGPGACPVCETSDYTVIVGECRNGRQTVHTVPPAYCALSTAMQQVERPCVSSLDASMQLLIGVGVTLCLALICTLYLLCKRNRKLEYKYMKLREKTGKKSGSVDYSDDEDEHQLPQAESCALEESEEDDDEDRVIFSKANQSRSSQQHRSQPLYAVDNPAQMSLLNDEM